MSNRRAIAESVRRRVLTEAGYRCAVPTCRTILAIDLHHLERVADGGGDEADNLLALCPNCHGLHHRGEIPGEALQVYKDLLVALNEGISREAKDLLLFLAMEADKRQQVWHSSNGILRFSPLIVAGIVEVHHSPPPISKNGAFLPGVHHLMLTERGKAVVAAWKDGNASALRIAQGMQ